MSGCRQLSDRIPDVVHGGARWSAAEAAHLAACADCRAEWELVVAAKQLVARAPVPNDTGALTRRVVARAAAHRGARSQARWRWRLGAAAAAAVVAAAWISVGPDAQPIVRPPAQANLEIALPELEPLETAELDSLLQTMDAPSTGWSALSEPTLGELDAEELEQVLGTWEG